MQATEHRRLKTETSYAASLGNANVRRVMGVGSLYSRIRSLMSLRHQAPFQRMALTAL